MGRRVAGRDRWARPWWRPLAYSAATFAAVGLLFHPLPAAAAPNVPAVPAVPVAPAVPDNGSRPVPLGTLLMPGQQPGQTPGQAGTGGLTTTPATPLPGVVMTPLLQKIEKQRNEIAALGDKLIKLGQDRDLARQQTATANQKVTDAQVALLTAQHDAEAAAAAALRDQAALPPGTFGSGLADLDSLSRMQRGDTATREAADRQLALVRASLAAAQAEQATATTSATDLSRQYDALNAQITKKQTALQKDEKKHADELSAAEAAQSAEDRRLGERYLDGTDQGRGAHPNAIGALKIALAQIGDPYVWSEEGPDRFDCSGLMQYSYTRASGHFPLNRVSRDQYKQTSQNLVDRYSLVPGDLLFFSSTNSWTGIHHVAMYAGKGMMVEAPRTGLNVRLTPVRWSRLFGATRIWGSVDHPTNSPDLNDLPPKEPNPASPSATPKPTKTSKPPTSPDPDPTKTTKPPGGGSGSPSNPTSPSTPPSSTSPEPSKTSDPPTGGGSNPPSGGGSNPPSGGDSQSPGENSQSPSDAQSQSAGQSKEASQSAGANPE
ncbi:C40 family peptidase [Actinoplanes sp. NPDC051633]|uniref:C40 family peptidase n=1 Tax=Actinoplanes sp. NPDC051633 TaxID=3155670 RepID=UPI00341D0E99